MKKKFTFDDHIWLINHGLIFNSRKKRRKIDEIDQCLFRCQSGNFLWSSSYDDDHCLDDDEDDQQQS